MCRVGFVHRWHITQSPTWPAQIPIVSMEIPPVLLLLFVSRQTISVPPTRNYSTHQYATSHAERAEATKSEDQWQTAATSKIFRIHRTAAEFIRHIHVQDRDPQSYQLTIDGDINFCRAEQIVSEGSGLLIRFRATGYRMDATHGQTVTPAAGPCCRRFLWRAAPIWSSGSRRPEARRSSSRTRRYDRSQLRRITTKQRCHCGLLLLFSVL
jgi:hypothetical protein